MLLVAFSFLLAAIPADLSTSSRRSNVILILADDLDLTLGSIKYMNRTLQLIANQGATFTNAYVNAPICCPSRSALLTGRYPHNIFVYNNSVSGGCASVPWQRTHEQNTIATALKSLNYTTFYSGKYLNQYGRSSVGGTAHVPPGWDHWYALRGNSVYYDYVISVNGKAKKYQDVYLTDLIGELALDFLQEHSGESFFMMLATPAAHAPFVPAPRHKRYFPDVRAQRRQPFNVTPTNKHWLVQMPPTSLPSDVAILDRIHGNRLRTLQSVDDLISNLVIELEQLNVIDRTYLIFTSDNGFHIGQFTQPWDKRQPYESDVHVPFFVRGPGIRPKTIVNRPIASVDLAPTILDLVGSKMADADGESLKSSLTDGKFVADKTILIEYWGEGDVRSVDSNCHLGHSDELAECSVDNWCKCQDSRNNTYVCLIEFASDGGKLKFCWFIDGFYEVYDLKTDPNELFNLRDSLEPQKLQYFLRELERLSKCKGSACT